MKTTAKGKNLSWFIKLMLFGILFGVVIYISTLAYILVNAEKNTLQNTTADVAVILGATPYWGDGLNPCLKARVLKGVQLFNEGKVKAIIVSGGKELDGTVTEAEVMKQIAVDAGMDSAYVFEEGKATSTYENIMFSKPGLDYYQSKKVVVVTEPYHSPRGELVAKQLLDQEIYIAPATESPCWKNNRYTHNYLLREPIALIYYFLTGKI
jgi:uncharacterized SAM-binding protein YcdF (DUF218 family)